MTGPIALVDIGAAGATHLVTLLTEREGARDLGELATKAGLQWIWCPLEDADTGASIAAVRPALEGIQAALRAGGAVVIHCSAGIHRTGMFGYAVLRVCGLDSTPPARSWTRIAGGHCRRRRRRAARVGRPDRECVVVTINAAGSPPPPDRC